MFLFYCNFDYFTVFVLEHFFFDYFLVFVISTFYSFCFLTICLIHIISYLQAWKMKNFGFPLNRGQFSLLNISRMVLISRTFSSAEITLSRLPCDMIATMHMSAASCFLSAENSLMTFFISKSVKSLCGITCPTNHRALKNVFLIYS